MSIPAVEIKTGSEVPFEQLLALYDSVGWYVYTDDQHRADLQKAIRNSTYVVSAWNESRLVGLARGLSDDVSIFYLQDILIRPEFQGKGIGKQLLNNCLERFGHVRSKVLLTDDDERQLGFYKSLGFKNIKDITSVRLNAFVQIAGIN